jgi:ribonuclease T1
MPENIDRALEEQTMRQYGLLGRGGNMGNALHAIDYGQLPQRAREIIHLITRGGPFPYPDVDNTPYQNEFGDLPAHNDYREFTVPIPNPNITPRRPEPEIRGPRRIVARSSGVLFFTACHYERVPRGGKSMEQRIEQTEQIDPAWRNGFYIITGMTIELRNAVRQSLRNLPAGVRTRRG